MARSEGPCDRALRRLRARWTPAIRAASIDCIGPAAWSTTMPRINVVYLYVGDLDRSIAFYRDHLGIPLKRHATDPHWAEAHLDPGIRFALHASGPSLRPQVPGTVRVNFEESDLEET